MKKKGWLFVCLLLILIGLCACQPSAAFSNPDKYRDLGNEYKAEVDYPTAFNNGASGPHIAPTETGYFFLGYDHLYFIDKQSLVVQPFCNRPECAHGETCSAYISPSARPLLQFYEGALYVTSVKESDSGYPEEVLYRLSVEDCTREEVAVLPYGAGDSTFRYFMHRGYLYMESGYGNGVQLERIPLNRLKDHSYEFELLYQQEEARVSPSFLYGDHYLSFAWNVEEDGKGGYQATGWLMDCNLKTGEIHKVPTPDLEEHSYYVPKAVIGNCIALRVITDEEYASAFLSPPQYSSNIQYLLYDVQKATITGSMEYQNDPLLDMDLYYDGEQWIGFNIEQYTDQNVDMQTVCWLDDEWNVVTSGKPVSAHPLYCVGDSDFSFLYYNFDEFRLDLVDKRQGTIEIKTIWSR